MEEHMNIDAINDLLNLSKTSGTDLFNQLLELFNSETPKRIIDIKNSVERQDYEQLNRAAHTLKSGAAYLGAKTLSKLCHDIELTTNEKKIPIDIDHKINAIEHHFNLALDYLNLKNAA